MLWHMSRHVTRHRRMGPDSPIDSSSSPAHLGGQYTVSARNIGTREFGVLHVAELLLTLTEGSLNDSRCAHADAA